MITRRALLAGSAVVALAAQADASVLLFLRRSPARFEGWKHINIGAWFLGRPVYPAAYPAFYTLAQMQGLRTLGFDSVRFNIEPDPMIAAVLAADTPGLNAYIAQIIAAGRLLRQADLRINFDLHNNTSSVYNANVILGGTTSDAAWIAYRTVAVALAKAFAASFAPEDACLDLFNEPPTAFNAAWASTFQPSLYTAVRAAAPSLTLILTGGDLGQISGLVSTANPIVPSQYDKNTLFNFHFYAPALFTNANRAGAGSPYKYQSALGFPGESIDVSAQQALATARINADGSLSAGQKTTAIADSLAFLTNYHDNLTTSWMVNELQIVARWAYANGIDRSRIYIGEVGRYQDASANSTVDAAGAAYFALFRAAVEKINHRWGLWTADQQTNVGEFFIQAPNTAALPTTSNVPAVIKAALGLS